MYFHDISFLKSTIADYPVKLRICQYESAAF
ncbi:MAG TPA: hypothetical protein DHV15_01670 [Treponema sp.]|uniref:Uncharacterized protein n=1 Tax=Treponema denticola (strain ATCC 35405 / DSM 14222 / CIP 103919 / JCM 8153 / KCTC 15104) TaxID=243275 RepID=Q73JV4_TREDE|nr:hypothetical protein TDE_2507 [Treponema denticola ATCC 35405]HCY94211.1 hypothetical protein [Treponema sp.]